MTAPLLSADDISCRIGGIQALDHVTFTVAAGEFVGIIGPNGAGKTTLVNTLTGFAPYQTGTWEFDGRSVGGKSAEALASLGLVRTFQNRGGFGGLSVADNLCLARGRHLSESDIVGIASQVGLSGWEHSPAEALSLASRKILGIAMAIQRGPRLVFLDEPLAGLDEVDRDRLLEFIVAANGDGTAVCMIEHDIRRTLDVAGRIIVLDNGRKSLDGPPTTVAEDPLFLETYLEG